MDKELEKILNTLIDEIWEDISVPTKKDWFTPALKAIHLYTLRKQLEQLKEIDSYDTYRQMLSCMEDLRADLEAQIKEMS